MKKFKFLTIHNIKNIIFSKGFIISNIILFLLTALIVNLPSLINKFAPTEHNLSIILYYEEDHSNRNKINKYLNNQANALENADIFFVLDDQGILPELTLSKIDEFTQSEYDALVYLKEVSDFDLLNVEIHYNDGTIQSKALLEEMIRQIRNSVLNIELKDVSIVKFEIDEEEMINTAVILAQIISIPMFMIILRALALVGSEIVQEKSTKAIETIISSVPPRTHFLAKLISSLVFVVLQTILLLLFAAISSLFIQSSDASVLESLGMAGGDVGKFLGIAILFLVVTSIFYLVVAGLLASMVNSQEDYQTVQSPLMMILMVGLYLNMFLPFAGETGIYILKVISFIPPFSGFTAPVAFALGGLLWWELLISLSLFVIVLGIILYFFGPIYKVSILNYDKSKFYKRFISNVKKGKLERKTRR